MEETSKLAVGIEAPAVVHSAPSGEISGWLSMAEDIQRQRELARLAQRRAALLEILTALDENPDLCAQVEDALQQMRVRHLT